MRRRLLIGIGIDEKDYPPLGKLLKSINLKELHSMFGRRSGQFFMYEDQINTYELLKGLNSFKIPSLMWDISRIENYYTKKELLSFPFHHIMAESFIDINENKKNLFYDYSKTCPKCDSGRIQSNDLIVSDRGKINRIHFTKTHYFEYIISRELGNLITKSNFTGINLRDVHSASKKRIGFQLLPTNTLPQLKENTYEFAPEWICKLCGYKGANMYGKYSGMDEYQIISPINAFEDFNKTYEFFGGGNISNQEIVISSRVVKAFKEFKVKKITLQPVHIYDLSGNKITPDIKPISSKIDIFKYKSHIGGSLANDLINDRSKNLQPLGCLDELTR